MQARLIACFVLLCSLAGCDRATKDLAEEHLSSGTVTLVEGVFDLTFAENRDVGFGLLRFIESDATRRSVIVAMVSVALVGVLIIVVLKTARPAIHSAAITRTVRGLDVAACESAPGSWGWRSGMVSFFAYDREGHSMNPAAPALELATPSG